MAGVEEGKVDWENKDVKADDRTNWFTLKAGETARICLIEPAATMILQHTLKIGKRFITFRCIAAHAQDGKCPGCEHSNTPTQRFMTNVLRYELDSTGKLIEPVRMSVQVLGFRGDKFSKIRDIKAQWGDLKLRDLLITCENSKRGGTFQNWDKVLPTPEAVWRRPDVNPVAKVVWTEGRKDLMALYGKIKTHDEISKLLKPREQRDFDGGSEADFDEAEPTSIAHVAPVEIELGIDEAPVASPPKKPLNKNELDDAINAL